MTPLTPSQLRQQQRAWHIKQSGDPELAEFRFAVGGINSFGHLRELLVETTDPAKAVIVQARLDQRLFQRKQKQARAKARRQAARSEGPTDA
jgi:hypothetical protein